MISQKYINVIIIFIVLLITLIVASRITKPIDTLVNNVYSRNCPRGPQGSKGPQGPMGRIGSMGPRGDTGDMGITGRTAIGLEGPRGQIGVTGSDGMDKSKTSGGTGINIGGNIIGSSIVPISLNVINKIMSDVYSYAKTEVENNTGLLNPPDIDVDLINSVINGTNKDNIIQYANNLICPNVISYIKLYNKNTNVYFQTNIEGTNISCNSSSSSDFNYRYDCIINNIMSKYTEYSAFHINKTTFKVSLTKNTITDSDFKPNIAFDSYIKVNYTLSNDAIFNKKIQILGGENASVTLDIINEACYESFKNKNSAGFIINKTGKSYWLYSLGAQNINLDDKIIYKRNTVEFISGDITGEEDVSKLGEGVVKNLADPSICIGAMTSVYVNAEFKYGIDLDSNTYCHTMYGKGQYIQINFNKVVYIPSDGNLVLYNIKDRTDILPRLENVSIRFYRGQVLINELKMLTTNKNSLISNGENKSFRDVRCDSIRIIQNNDDDKSYLHFRKIVIQGYETENIPINQLPLPKVVSIVPYKKFYVESQSEYVSNVIEKKHVAYFTYPIIFKYTSPLLTDPKFSTIGLYYKDKIVGYITDKGNTITDIPCDKIEIVFAVSNLDPQYSSMSEVFKKLDITYYGIQLLSDEVKSKIINLASDKNGAIARQTSRYNGAVENPEYYLDNINEDDGYSFSGSRIVYFGPDRNFEYASVVTNGISCNILYFGDPDNRDDKCNSVQFIYNNGKNGSVKGTKHLAKYAITDETSSVNFQQTDSAVYYPRKTNKIFTYKRFEALFVKFKNISYLLDVKIMLFDKNQYTKHMENNNHFAISFLNGNGNIVKTYTLKPYYNTTSSIFYNSDDISYTINNFEPITCDAISIYFTGSLSIKKVICNGIKTDASSSSYPFETNTKSEDNQIMDKSFVTPIQGNIPWWSGYALGLKATGNEIGGSSKDYYSDGKYGYASAFIPSSGGDGKWKTQIDLNLYNRDDDGAYYNKVIPYSTILIE